MVYLSHILTKTNTKTNSLIMWGNLERASEIDAVLKQTEVKNEGTIEFNKNISGLIDKKNNPAMPH